MINFEDVKKAIEAPEAVQAHKQHELSKYTTQELKDELARRGVPMMYMSDNPAPFAQDVGGGYADTIEQEGYCKHNQEMGYCHVKGCEGGL